MANKSTAIAFLELASSGRVGEAFRRVTKGFTHHNPYFAGDSRSLKAGMEEASKRNPKQELEVKRAIEEGDLVAVHSHVRPEPDGPGIAVVHIFRFEAGQIAELWDVGQLLPADSPNENGAF
jgi:predicted SnoaL-like aldol condensation-catalyzing enzyme